ncbi:hypothetical protein J7L18_00960, partial [Candidatus Bathyarchaeota archaeon]|nr:hypothetical protein [Candidatus Bathyarchaeota archaeon]
RAFRLMLKLIICAGFIFHGFKNMLMRPDDLLSFSSGCFEVTRALIDLAGQGYDCLLIPCRDAFPILAGAIQALKTVEGGTKFLERHPALKEVHRKRGILSCSSCPSRLLRVAYEVHRPSFPNPEFQRINPPFSWRWMFWTAFKGYQRT